MMIYSLFDFLFKNHFWPKYFLLAEINLTTRAPLYICPVDSLKFSIHIRHQISSLVYYIFSMVNSSIILAFLNTVPVDIIATYQNSIYQISWPICNTCCYGCCISFTDCFHLLKILSTNKVIKDKHFASPCQVP